MLLSSTSDGRPTRMMSGILTAGALAALTLSQTGCIQAPRRVQYFPPTVEGQPRPPIRLLNQVQTVIGEDRQAVLILAPSDEWELGARIRLRRAGQVTGTALITEVDERGAKARVVAVTDPRRPIAPGDTIEPIEMVVTTPTSPQTPGTASSTVPGLTVGSNPEEERAYYELAAKILRLPSDQAPELRRLQEELRKRLTPTLLPEASR